MIKLHERFVDRFSTKKDWVSLKKDSHIYLGFIFVFMIQSIIAFGYSGTLRKVTVIGSSIAFIAAITALFMAVFCLSCSRYAKLLSDCTKIEENYQMGINCR